MLADFDENLYPGVIWRAEYDRIGHLDVESFSKIWVWGSISSKSTILDRGRPQWFRKMLADFDENLYPGVIWRAEYDRIGHLEVESFFKIWVWGSKVENRPFSTLVDHSGCVRFRPILMKIYNQRLSDA